MVGEHDISNSMLRLHGNSMSLTVLESYLRRAADLVFKALQMKNIELVHQADGEDDLKLGKLFETAENNTHSERKKHMFV